MAVINPADIPGEVVVFGQRFKVTVCDPSHWSTSGMGRCSIRHGEILLNRDMGLDAALSTLLHECIHAALDVTGQAPEKCEPLAGCLEAFMFSFLRDNGGLVRRIADATSAAASEEELAKRGRRS